MKTIRISDKIIEERAELIKSLLNYGNKKTFNYLISVLSNEIAIQPVPYCDVGCAHCIGHACKNDNEVVSSDELKDYLDLLMETVGEHSSTVTTRVVFSGVYGDPFCGFGEENSIDYYSDLFKTVAGFNLLKRATFITSGFHLNRQDLVKDLLMNIKETGKNTDTSLFVNFSVDSFHGKRVPQTQIIETIKTMREVFHEDNEKSFVKNSFGFIGQEMSSTDGVKNGKDYLDNFLKKLNSIFDKDYDTKSYFTKINSTASGRDLISEEKYISGALMTKAADGELVVFFVNDDRMYEYALKRNDEGKLDRSHFKKIKANLALDQLTLKLNPIFKKGFLGKKKYVLLEEFCSDDKKMPIHIKTSKKLAFENHCDYY